jgi:hypothetical protein
MEVRCQQLHTLVTLPPVPIGQEAAWSGHGDKKIPLQCPYQELNPGQLYLLLYLYIYFTSDVALGWNLGR